jgi:Ca-activated chloride channel family protein
VLRLPNGQEIVKVVNYPVDKEILQKIAKATDAKFFEAQNQEGLASIYDEIDQLEKSEVELSVNAIFEELFAWPLGLALALLLLEIILARTLFLRIP